MAYAEKEKGWFSKAWTWVSNKVEHAFNWGTNVVKTVYNDAKDAVKGINEDLKSGASALQQTANRAVDVTGATVQGISSNLSMPLAIGAVGLGAFFLLKK